MMDKKISSINAKNVLLWTYIGESSKFPKSRTSENLNLKLAVCLQIVKNSKFNGQIPIDKLELAVCLQIVKNSKFNGQIHIDKLKLNQESYYYLHNSTF